MASQDNNPKEDLDAPKSLILTELAEGRTNREIADRLGYSESWVKVQIGNFFIEYDGNQEMEITIFNTLGELIYRKPDVQNKAEVDIEQYGSGLYPIRIRVGNKSTVMKIIVR